MMESVRVGMSLVCVWVCLRLDMVQDGEIEAAEQFGVWIPAGGGGRVG